MSTITGYSRRRGRYCRKLVTSTTEYTSVASGNWSTPETWTPAGIPGFGDTVIIAAGHTITVNTHTIIGNRPDPVASVVTCQTTGALVIGTDVTLVVTGNITMGTGGFTMNAGSSLIGDIATGLAAGWHSNTYGAEGASFTVNGTSGNRCTISSIGAGTFYIDAYMSGANGADIASIDVEYCDCFGLGDSTHRPFYTRRGSMSFSHVTFDECFALGNGTGYFYADRDVVISYCNFSNSQDTYDCVLSNQSATAITGARTIEFTAFDHGPNLSYNWAGTAITDSYVPAYSTYPTSADERMSAFENCFLGKTGDFLIEDLGVKNCFRYTPTGDGDTTHLLLLDANYGDQTIDGVIFEHGSDWTIDDCDGILQNGANSSSHTVTVQNCLVLPNAAGRASCTLVTDNCAYANWVFTINKNTFLSTGGGALVAVHGEGTAGRITSFQSNLGWCEDATPTGTYLLADVDYTPAEGLITVGDYNGYDYINVDYDTPDATFGSAPGTHDLNEDPDFVDSDRDLASWAAYALGATGTDAQKRATAIAAFAAMNDPSSPNYNAAAVIADLIAWVKAGFAPQNANYADSGHDAGRIGAIEPV